MNQKIKFSIYGLVFWFLLFLAWEWYFSHPKVSLPPISFPKSKEQKIDSILVESLTRYLIPGVALGVVEEGKITYIKSFGYQNLAKKDCLRITTPVPVASISKLFTALATAEYFGDQGLPITTPISELINAELEFPEDYKSLTLNQLLSHTSGIRDLSLLGKIGDWTSSSPLRKLPSRLSSISEKKGAYHYADTNFDLLGFLLMQHSQVDFDQLLTQMTLKKAGMSQAFWIQSTEIPSDSIQGYQRTFPWRRIKKEKFSLPLSPSPSAGLAVSAEDLSKFLLHLSRGKMSDFYPEIEWLQTKSGIPAGFQSIVIHGKPYLGHFGEQGGFSSVLLISLDWETGIFVLSNAADHADHRKKISSEVLQLIHTPS